MLLPSFGSTWRTESPVDLETRLRRTLEEQRDQLPAPRHPDVHEIRLSVDRRRRWRTGIAGAVALMVVAVAVAVGADVWDRRPGQVRLDPGPTDGPVSGWQRYLGDGFEISYPPRWRPAPEALTPNLTSPVEIVTFGTGPLEVGGQDCAQVPEAAVEAMGPDDVLVTVQRRDDPDGYPPRPQQFDEFTLDRLAFGECFDNRDRIDFAGVDFATADDGYTAYAFFGVQAGTEQRSRVLRMLNTFRVGQPGDDMACTTEPVPASKLPADVRGWGQDADVTGAATLWAAVPNSDWITYNPDPPTAGYPYGLKQSWFRTASGQVTIDVERLDGPGDATIRVPDGYGTDGFQVSGIEFDTPGCWRIVGTDGTSATTIHVNFPGRAAQDRYEPGAVWKCHDTLDAHESRVIAGYTTTGANIREWQRTRIEPGGPSASPDWTRHPDDAEVIVCIVDDVIMKGTPDGDTLARSLVFITSDGDPQPALSTYKDNLDPTDGPAPAPAPIADADPDNS